MYLIAMAWLYVALMMAAAEATHPTGTVFGALLTFLLYGLLPVTLFIYLMGGRFRRKARAQAEAVQATPAASEALAQVPPGPAAAPAPHVSVGTQPDGGCEAPGDPVTPERKEA